MPIELPNLDDLGWDELIGEARSVIPAYAPGWTDHNPSDPGITIVELLAHLADVLMFRTNQISLANRQTFLRLIRGPGDEPQMSTISGETIATISGLREVRRAVTTKDFEELALTTKPVKGYGKLQEPEQVARVKCIASRNLTDDPESNVAAPGHVSVIVVSDRRAQSSAALLRAVRHTLEPARLLTTRVHVVRPRFVTLSVRLTIVPEADADCESLPGEAVELIERYFDPLCGGHDGKGWPFGRYVYVSELYQLLDRLPGVDYIRKTRDSKGGEELAELVVGPDDSGRLLWSEGELEAIALNPDELVSVWVEPSDILIARK
jgi:hypothetical protein